jgi:cytochrome c oxidase subunit 1
MHGLFMVFFFLLPAIPGVLGNFLLPLMIGARDTVFPRLNLLSWYCFVIGGICLVSVSLKGGIESGWTLLSPNNSGDGSGYLLAIAGITLASISMVLTGVNFLTTTHKLRTTGMTWSRLPIFVWALYIASLVAVLATPILICLMVLLGFEKIFGAGIFDPRNGGDPFLHRRLFWMYARPALFVMVLPAIGVVTQILSAYSSRRSVFGYRIVVGSLILIAALGIVGSGSHLYVSSQPLHSSLTFSFLNFLLVIPFSLILFSWLATLYGGSIRIQAPMLYAFAFILLLVIGVATGFLLTTTAANVFLHSTYFVVAHFHFLLAGAVVAAYVGGLHFWWPRMTGRQAPETAGRTAAVITFVGVNMAFLPLYILGSLGMPRRHHTYPPEFEVFNVLASAGATVLLAAYLIPILYLSWSLRFGRLQNSNPVGATGLEWSSASPPRSVAI